MKTNINLTLDADLVKEARERKVEFSKIFNNYLKKHLERLRRNAR